MYLGLDNHMMLVYEGGGGADTLKSPSSHNIIHELENIQVLEEFRPDVSHGPDSARLRLGQAGLAQKSVAK